MKKIVSILGARPQFIKAAMVSRALSQYPEIQEVLLHTGQHYDDVMSQIFFRELDIKKPEYNLNINQLSRADMIATMVLAIKTVLVKEAPDLVLVYGDTNSTLAGAMAANNLNAVLAHVEAGLRSFNQNMPEELNRIEADKLADILFCPCQRACTELVNEGYAHKQIVNAGDVMYDAALHFLPIAEIKSTILKKLALKNYLLATVHRAENTDNESSLKNIFAALDKINNTLPVIIPTHPRTKHQLTTYNIKTNCQLIEPVGYLDMLCLLKHSQLVATDSGGLQKEAYFLNKNCLVLRTETEWEELIAHGSHILTGADPAVICNAFNKLQNKTPSSQINLYGNGQASQTIADIIKDSR